MAYTMNETKNVGSAVPYEMMGPLADRPAVADLNSVYIATDSTAGTWDIYWYDGTQWVKKE